MTPDICISDGYARPAIFFDTEDELRQFVADADETREKREEAERVRAATRPLFPAPGEEGEG